MLQKSTGYAMIENENLKEQIIEMCTYKLKVLVDSKNAIDNG